MNVEKVLTDFRNELRKVAWQDELIEELPFVTRRKALNDGPNGVVAFNMDAGNATQIIREEIAHFKSLGKEFEWKVFSFDSPSDLVDRLQRAGLSVGDREAVVIYDLSKGLGPFEGPFSCEVRRVECVEQLAHFRQVAEEIFSKIYEQTTNHLAEALRTGQKGHDAYVAYMEGIPVSVGRLYTDPNSAFGGLYGGGTLHKYRSQGCYRAMTAARARDAAAHGARYLQVDALPTSLPILLRLGFVQIADTWPASISVAKQ